MCYVPALLYMLLDNYWYICTSTLAVPMLGHLMTFALRKVLVKPSHDGNYNCLLMDHLIIQNLLV